MRSKLRNSQSVRSSMMAVGSLSDGQEPPPGKKCGEQHSNSVPFRTRRAAAGLHRAAGDPRRTERRGRVGRANDLTNSEATRSVGKWAPTRERGKRGCIKL